MHQFNNILVSVDGSQRDPYVAKRAAELAQACEAKLTFLRVVEPIPEQVGWLVEGYPPPVDLQQAKREQAETEMAGLRELLGDLDLQMEFVISEGQASIEIIRKCIKDEHDLVVRASDRSNMFSEALFGNTCQNLIRKCPSPVWAMKASKASRYHRILAAISLPHSSDDHLNNKIIEYALHIAKHESAEVQVIHVWKPGVMPEIPHLGSVKQEAIHQWLVETESRHHKWFRDFLKQYNFEDDDKRVHFVRGEPSLVIAETAEEIQADLLVMGSVARRGIKGFLIGNTAERLLNEVGCSLLTLKPDDFESPVA